MFLFLTTCLIWTSAFEYYSDRLYETLPSTGECPEGKILDELDCRYARIGSCKDAGGTSADCFDGNLDSNTHGCGCILKEDGKLDFNEPSGKSCKAGEEASMVCKQKADVDVCEDVDGWTVTCNSSCREYGSKYEYPWIWFENTYGDLDTLHFTAAECAALCTGECVGFQMSGTGCDYFFTGVTFSDSETWGEDTSCFQRTPPVEVDCADHNRDVGEGWDVECGALCYGETLFSARIQVLEKPWITGVTIAQCQEICEGDDCEFYHFSPQNGGSCRFANETIEGLQKIENSNIAPYFEGACVHRGLPESDHQPDNSDCNDFDPESNPYDLWACVDPESGEHDAEGDHVVQLISAPDGMEACEWVDQMFSKGGCCENCSQCFREWYEDVFEIDGCESDDEDIFSKIKDGHFSSLTTLELMGLGVIALVLFMLIVGLCYCCCKCSGRKETKQFSMC